MYFISYKFLFSKDVSQVNQNVKDNILGNNSHELKNGDIVYITAYVDLCNIYVRNVDDDDELLKLNKRVNDCCSIG